MKPQTDKRERAESKPQPTHDVKLRRPTGERAVFERIGAAWKKDDGSFYVRLNGTQIVADGFHLFPIETER